MRRAWCIAALALVACGEDGGDDDAGAIVFDAGERDAHVGFPFDAGPLPEALPACDVTPPDALLLRPGPQDDGSFITLDARRAVAAGPSVVVDGFPSDVAVHPTLRVAYVVTAGARDRLLLTVDMDTLELRQSLEPEDVLYGLEVSPDGGRVYVAGGESRQLHAFDVGADGTLSEAGSLDLDMYVSGTELSPDGATIWAGNFDGEGVAEVDAATLTVRRTIDLETAAWDLVHLPGRDELYVSDLRGEGIAVIDLASGTVAETIPLPVSPAGMARADDESTVWVAVSGADVVAALDPATRSVVATRQVAESDYVTEDGAPLPNSNVSSLWHDAASDRLYVTRGADNAVSVLEASTLSVLGALPSDRYPTDVELAPDARTLVVVSGKGGGTGPGGDAKGLRKGTVAFIDLMGLDLAAQTEQAQRGYGRTADLYAPDCEAFPVPTAPGRPTPIEHVILIVKENKTYDSILGDLDQPGADGDPSLAEWGLPITPNHHALAREFAHSDNFYVLTPNSDSGHLFLTATHMTEFAERVWIEDVRDLGYLSWPTDPLSSPGGFNFFTHLADLEVDLRIYGEIVGITRTSRSGLRISRFSDRRYPGGPAVNYTVTDEEKARYVASQIEAGQLATFSYLLLPNDHTVGTSAGQPTPESMVADNDYAMGIVLDALSHSPYWPRSVVFILEDDPQGTSDHIDAHRSVLHVVSPWARRDYVSHVHSSYLSVFATIERILGVPPVGRPDASAAPLYDMFTTEPDFTPYEAREREVPEAVNPTDGMGVTMSARMDFRSPDRNPELGTLLHWYRAYRQGHVSRDEAERRLAEALEADEDEDEDGEVDESLEDARVFDAEWARYRAWHRQEYGEDPPALRLGPVVDPGSR